MRPLTTSLTLLVAIPYLGACADSAEGGTPPVEGVVQGVSLEQPVVTERPPNEEPSPEDSVPVNGSKETGDAAMQAMAKDLLGVQVSGIDELGSGGIEVEEGDDYLVIRPDGCSIVPARIETYDDHRVAMSFGLLRLLHDGIEIEDPACVAKSFPGYWDELARFVEHHLG